MVNLNDVLLAMSSIPVDDPIAEIWGRGLQGGHEIIEYTGTLPITITADGNALLDYKLYGNTVQDGTPTPENPVDVVGCGERTENLFDKDNVLKDHYLDNGTQKTAAPLFMYVLSDYIPIVSNTATISAKLTETTTAGSHWAVYDENKTFIRGGIAFLARDEINKAKVVDTSGAAFIRVDYALAAFVDCMLNLGSNALPYEPYGYKLPMVSRTENLFDKNATDTANGYVDGEHLRNNGAANSNSLWAITEYIPITGGNNYTFDYGSSSSSPAICYYDSSKQFIQGISYGGQKPKTVSIPSNVSYIRFSFMKSYADTIMLVQANSLPETYVPYGYKSSPIYIGDTQLMQDEYVSFSEQKIYKGIDGTLTPTDPPVPLPEIPTFAGTTVIDYDGTPKPSEMYIKYRR